MPPKSQKSSKKPFKKFYGLPPSVILDAVKSGLSVTIATLQATISENTRTLIRFLK
jgi:hypothetical protein